MDRASHQHQTISICIVVADDTAALSRKRKKSRTEIPDKSHPHVEEDEQQEELDDERPPSPKFSKMRSDRYDEREPESRRRSGERRGEDRGGGEVRVHGEVKIRNERPSMKRYEAPGSRFMAKKAVRAQVTGV